MLLIQFVELVSRLSTGAQILFIVCAFVLSMYSLTLIAFSPRMVYHLRQLIRAWQRPDNNLRKEDTGSSQQEH